MATFDDVPTAPAAEDETVKTATPDPPAVARFRACRWHEQIEGAAEYCSHGEVLPYSGKHGFNADAWCPDYTFFKVRRKVRRRDDDGF